MDYKTRIFYFSQSLHTNEKRATYIEAAKHRGQISLRHGWRYKQIIKEGHVAHWKSYPSFIKPNIIIQREWQTAWIGGTDWLDELIKI